jgi:hypothetical protein
MNSLTKTRRRLPDISGGFPGLLSDRADQFMKFLVTNAEDAFTRPWHRLEPGMRRNRLRKFVEDEAVRFQFSEEDQTAMFQTLNKALDKKQLNSKSIVQYDAEQQKILEIKGLTFHKQADGRIVFQFSERKTGTIRKRSGSPPQGEQQTQQPKN